MRRTRFLVTALALCATPAAFAAESQSNPPAAAPATSAEAVTPTTTPAPEATPTSESTSTPAVETASTTPVDSASKPSKAPKTIELGPQGVDEQGRVGRLHTVSRGDTLWDISAAYLGTPWVWPSVWTDNHAIANPHMIRPGDRIWITANEMRVVTDDEADAFLERLVDAPAAPDGEAMPADEELVEVEAPAAAEEMAPSEPVLAAVPEPTQTGRQITVSTRAAMGFVTAEQLAGSSSIVDSPNERVYVAAGDTVYLGIGEGDTKVGDHYTIFDVIEEVRDVETNRLLGHHVDVLGWLEVKQLTGDTSIGEIRMSYAEIRRGARIMVRPQISRHVTVMRTPDANEGSIVFLPDSNTVMADGGYVYLNRGELDGLEVGSELEAFERGRIQNDVPRGVDVQTPDHKVATLVVVSVEPQTAVAFVLNAARELEVGDAVRPRTANLAAR